MSAAVNLDKMSGPELVAMYNKLSAELGGAHGSVNRFSNRATAVRRVQALLDEVAARTPAPAPAPAPVEEAPAPVNATPTEVADIDPTTLSIGAMREWFNAQVPEAQRLGVRAKHLNSPFESRASGVRRIQKLIADLKIARGE